jgi:hypothetical protein
MDSAVDMAMEAGRSAYRCGHQRWANPYGVDPGSRLAQMQACAWAIGWAREHHATVMRQSLLARHHTRAWETQPPCP